MKEETILYAVITLVMFVIATLIILGAYFNIRKDKTYEQVRWALIALHIGLTLVSVVAECVFISVLLN